MTIARITPLALCLMALPFVWGLGVVTGWFAHAGGTAAAATGEAPTPTPTPNALPTAQMADDVVLLVDRETNQRRTDSIAAIAFVGPMRHHHGKRPPDPPLLEPRLQ